MVVEACASETDPDSWVQLGDDVFLGELFCLCWSSDDVGRNRGCKEPHSQSGVGRSDKPHCGDAKGQENCDDCNGFCSDAEPVPCAPISNDSAEEGISEQPIVEAIRLLREQEGCHQNWSGCWDSRNNHTDEGNCNPQPAKSEEHGAKTRVLYNSHDQQRRQSSRRQHVGSKVSGCGNGSEVCCPHASENE